MKSLLAITITITFNIDKSVILPIYFYKSYHKPVKLYIDNKLLKVVKSYRYLGHWISEDLSDDIDIYSNIKQLYKQSYAISYNFNHMIKVICYMIMLKYYNLQIIIN